MKFKKLVRKITLKKALKVTSLAVGLFISLSILSVILFKWVPVPFSAVMIQDKIDAAFSGEEFTLNYNWVSYEEISKNMKIAVIAAEDQKFPDHWGFDIESMSDAIEKSKRGKKLRGASTITQQTAKNLFCWKGRSFIRKGFEAYYTVLLELFWTKERILEVYLNIIELGKGIYGVEAASKIYFKKNAVKLSLNESAILTAVLPSPRRWPVKNPTPYIYKRTAWILRQVDMLGGSSYLKRIE